MSSSKLRLKRTLAEQAERDFRKARKAAWKADRSKRAAAANDHPHESKRRRTTDTDGADDVEYGPQPASYASTSTSGSYRVQEPDYDSILAERAEARFRDKLWGAFGDDERLDTVEASLNSYAHVPRRWRGGGMDRMDDDPIDPHFMEEDEYAEWIRAGMWRRKHAAEHEEQMRREAERKARAEREKAVREETKRLERAAESERTKRRRERDLQRAVQVRALYESRWKTLLAHQSAESDILSFEDIPWPVDVHPNDTVRIEDLTAEEISTFLFPLLAVKEEGSTKDRRERLRETMLRFHPDKFEGRIMQRVRDADRQHVKEAVGLVARNLNALMDQYK